MKLHIPTVVVTVPPPKDDRPIESVLCVVSVDGAPWPVHRFTIEGRVTDTVRVTLEFDANVEVHGPEMVTPRSIDREAFGLPPADFGQQGWSSGLPKSLRPEKGDTA